YAVNPRVVEQSELIAAEPIEMLSAKVRRVEVKLLEDTQEHVTRKPCTVSQVGRLGRFESTSRGRRIRKTPRHPACSLVPCPVCDEAVSGPAIFVRSANAMRRGAARDYEVIRRRRGLVIGVKPDLA